MPTTIPSPPPDNSGGFMRLSYSNGSRTHKMRIHVAQFALATPGPNNSYQYSGVGQHGSELGVNDTFTALATILAGFYLPAWTFALDALFQMQSGSPVEVFPTPSPAPVVGTGTGANSVFLEGEWIYNFRTAGGHRARLVLIEPANFAFQASQSIAANAAGTNNQKLVAYLSGSATSIVAHDGTLILSPAHQTTPYNRRLRRHYMTA